MRAAITATTLCLSVSRFSEADNAEAAIRRETRIAAEELSAALRELEKDRNLELIFFAEDVRGIHTGGASGDLTLDEALNKILAGTGLTYHYIDRKTVTIVPVQGTGRGSGFVVEHKSGQSVAKEHVTSEEVVVTARKRKEDIQNVPSAVSVISGAKLDEFGATQLTDYAAYVPGLSVVQGFSPGTDLLILRGLNTPTPTALIETYIDDTPVGASSAMPDPARRALDLLPYDFERIEVLEGPQGTLYGANAMGGLLKYVTRKPNLDRVTAQIGADFKENGTASAGGWNAHGSINLPIAAGTAGLRVSLSQDITPGFIAEPNQNRTDGNQVREQAGHIALLLEPSAAWSVDLSALLQHLYSADGAAITLTSSNFTPDAGRLSNSERVPLTFESRLQYYSASINGDLRWANFICATSYSLMRSSGSQQVYFPLDKPTGRADSGLQLSLSKLTQEFRLVSPAGGRLEWLLGTFYTDEQGDQVQSAYALDASNVSIPDQQLNPELHLFIPSRYREYAAFGDTTWKLTDALDLTVGLRESRNVQSFAGIPVCSAVFVSSIGVCPPAGAGASSQNVFNFTFSSSYHFSPDVMAYVRVASGYRPGGPNVPGPGIPTSVAADTSINSEVGIKSAWLDRKVRFDAAIYQIDWNHLQIIAIAPSPLNVSYGANGNKATVRGLEAATTVAPVSNLHLGLNFTYTHAVLSEPMPSGSTLVGDRGDRLPYAPMWSGSLTADYTHSLKQGWKGTIAAGWRYTGQRYTTINNPGNCPINCAGAPIVPSLRPYGVVDLRAGVSNDAWSLHVAVRNLTDKYALVDMTGAGGPPFDVEPIFATVLSGRLFTLGVDRRF
jgi:iron complex outermembrane receptor protein